MGPTQHRRQDCVKEEMMSLLLCRSWIVRGEDPGFVRAPAPPPPTSRVRFAARRRLIRSAASEGVIVATERLFEDVLLGT